MAVLGAQLQAGGAFIQQPAAATNTAPQPPAPKPPGGAAAAAAAAAAATAAANKSKRPLLPPKELFVVSSTYPLQLNSPQRAVVLSALTDLSRQYFVFEGKEITPARRADFAKMTYKRVCVCVCVCVCGVCVCVCVCVCRCVHSQKNLYSRLI
jgi:hypothetical protein